MSQWYYAKNGVQNGPVSLEQLRQLAASGGLHPESDLVWNPSMKDWTPAGHVSGIFTTPPPQVSAPTPDPANPYAAPQSAWINPVVEHFGEVPAEIMPGSDPIDAMACVKRGFELAQRHASTIAIVFLIYFGVNIGLNIASSLIQEVLSVTTHGHGQASHEFVHQVRGPVGTFASASSTRELNPVVATVVFVMWAIRSVITLYLELGLMRVCLDLVSGKQTSVGMLFGEGRKLLRGIGASILYGLMVSIGLLLLIVPGIYLAVRYGQFLKAIVDRDMGVMDSFAYSSSITTNNRMNLFLLGLLSFLMMVAGLLACCVGIFVATPIVMIASAVSYRWMQYGRRAAMDYPGTQTPLLAGTQG